MHSCQKMASKCPAGRALGLNRAFPKQQQCSEKPYALMWAVGRNVMGREPGGSLQISNCFVKTRRASTTWELRGARLVEQKDTQNRCYQPNKPNKTHLSASLHCWLQLPTLKQIQPSHIILDTAFSVCQHIFIKHLLQAQYCDAGNVNMKRTQASEEGRHMNI